jgi:hypothetical protein
VRFVLALMLFAGCASWSRGDVARQVVFVGLVAVDYKQTQAIVARCDETNPIIGECGENVGLAHYFISAFLVHTLLVHVLVREPRRAVQYLSIGAQGATVWMNTRMGQGSWP